METGMALDGWRAALILRGVDLRTGEEVPVSTGLVEIGGDWQVGLRVGDDPTAVLTRDTDVELSAHLRRAIHEKYRMRGEL